MENLISLRRQLERDRFRKEKNLKTVFNPLVEEFLERDLRLIDLQLQWVDVALNEQN